MNIQGKSIFPDVWKRILGSPLTELLTPRVRYLGTDQNVLSLEALTEIYHLVAQNLKLARERMKKKSKVHPPTFTVGDIVLLRNQEAKSLEPRFKDTSGLLRFTVTKYI